MSRGRFAFFLLSLGLLIPIMTGTLSRAAAGAEAGEDSLYKHLSVFSEVLQLIRRTYVDETSLETLFSGALDGSTEALDPLASYVAPAGVAAFERAREIGVRHSGVSIVKDRGVTYVLAVEPESPGEAAGLRRGDIISKLAGKSTRPIPLWEIQASLAGEPGTTVELELLRRGQTVDTLLELARYAPRPPALTRHDGVPLLRIDRFEAGVEGPVSELLASLAGEPRLIVDLRGVAGGEAAAAYRVADLFVGGVLGELRNRAGVIESYPGGDERLWTGELLVLTDRGSQGASEILASVLRQAAGAELVGESTFGHAGHETVVALSSGARVRLTDAFYTGPDGVLLDRSLEPELVVSETSRSFAEAEVPLDELILKRALERLSSEETAAGQVS